MSSGTYYLRARYYDPEIGRFITADSNWGKAADPLSLNLYTYCNNDPIQYADYNGHNPVAVIYMYVMAVANSPDTQMDMQFVAMDLSQGNYFAAAFDSAGALIPGATGLGKAADDTASAALRFFGKKSATEIDTIRQTFGNGQVVMSYKYLKQLVKGSGLETHHLIEKRFADTLGIEADDILSVALNKDTHQEITNLFRDKIKYNSAFDFLHPERLTTSRATDQQIWDATREVYTETGMTQYLNPLKESIITAGKNLDWGEW